MVTQIRRHGMFRSGVTGIGMLVIVAGLTGCVGQGEYDNIYETLNSTKSALAKAERERDEYKSALDLLRSRMGSGEGALAALERQNADLRAQLDRALSDYRGMQDRLGNLNFGPVDAETDAALKAFAAQYPDLVTYDSARGMLRFNSDLTFDSGSDVVKEPARRALQTLSQILNDSATTAYDIVIEGHTDSQRISNAGTRQKHPTNRHLSVHRSISVIAELAGMSVRPDRMLAAGWGEFHPSVTNSPSGNTPENRRVEIFLAKGRGGESGAAIPSGDSGTTTSGSGAIDGSRPPTRQRDITK